MRQAVIGIQYENLAGGNRKILSDAELLKELNQLKQKKLNDDISTCIKVNQYSQLIDDCVNYLQEIASNFNLPFKCPSFKLLILIVGSNSPLKT
jgi:hypothetical protein